MEKTKVVLLTGGSTGIGLDLAILLMEKGIRVYSASRRLSQAKQSVSGGAIIPVQMDVNRKEQIQKVVEQILHENNRLDAVVCNAGNGIAGSVEDFEEEEVRYQFETNFFGAVSTIQSCLPVFRAQSRGKIMVTSSLAAEVPIPFQAFYSASKSALTIFMQALALETRPFGIQCCTFLPGDTKTDFTQMRKYCINSQSDQSAYIYRMKKAVLRMEEDEKNGMEAQYVAKQMANQLLRKQMKKEVVPGLKYKVIRCIYRLLPLSMRLWVVGKIY